MSRLPGMLMEGAGEGPPGRVGISTLAGALGIGGLRWSTDWLPTRSDYSPSPEPELVFKLKSPCHSSLHFTHPDLSRWVPHPGCFPSCRHTHTHCDPFCLGLTEHCP